MRGQHNDFTEAQPGEQMKEIFGLLKEYECLGALTTPA